ncbi:MAG: hypothetical protein OES25_16915 [Acidobacteriota bacterium]|nr:hypothetical protein [Acidobacteriota bacterium]
MDDDESVRLGLRMREFHKAETDAVMVRAMDATIRPDRVHRFSVTGTLERLLGMTTPPHELQEIPPPHDLFFCEYPSAGRVLVVPWDTESCRFLFRVGSDGKISTDEFNGQFAQSRMRKYMASPEFDERHLPGCKVWMDVSGETCSDLHDLVSNTVAYINSAKSDVQPRTRYKSGAKRKNPDRDRLPVRHWVVGTSLRLPPAQRKSLGGSSSSWTLTKRFWVRGHWRNQAHGEGRLERKLIWVMPHEKGPKDIQEALVRTYHVDIPNPDPDEVRP